MMFYTLLFLSATLIQIPGVWSRNCYNCQAPTDAGCDSGTCSGDFCIDVFTEGSKGKKGRSRGCYSMLAGNFPMHNGTFCGYLDFNNTFASACGCNDDDFCMNGTISVPSDKQGSVACIEFGSKTTTNCYGDRCLWTSNGKGSQKYADGIHFDSIAWPSWYVEGCVKTQLFGEKCTCNTNFCNNKYPDSHHKYDPDRPTISCNSSKTEECEGHGCLLFMIYRDDDNSNVSIQQGCRNESEQNHFEQFCSDMEINGIHIVQCLCATPFCNSDLETAVEAIETYVSPSTAAPTGSYVSNHSCYSCSYKSPFKACQNGSCNGDYCVEIYDGSVGSTQGTYTRGCYSFLAGEKPFSEPGISLSGIQVAQNSDIMGHCSDPHCIQGPDSLVPTRTTSTRLMCLARGEEKQVACFGDRCVWTKDKLGCQMLGDGHYDNIIDYPDGKNVGCVNTTYAGEVCICEKEFCNQMKPLARYDLLNTQLIQCNSSKDGYCSGNGCTLRIVQSGAATTIQQGCRLESGSNQFIPRCIKVGGSTDYKIECLCSDGFCNSDLNTAIVSIDKVPTTTAPPTTTTPATTPEPTTTTPEPTTTTPEPTTTTTETTTETTTPRPTTTVETTKTTTAPTTSTTTTKSTTADASNPIHSFTALFGLLLLTIALT